MIDHLFVVHYATENKPVSTGILAKMTRAGENGKI